MLPKPIAEERRRGGGGEVGVGRGDVLLRGQGQLGVQEHGVHVRGGRQKVLVQAGVQEEREGRRGRGGRRRAHADVRTRVLVGLGGGRAARGRGGALADQGADVEGARLGAVRGVSAGSARGAQGKETWKRGEE